MRNQIWHRNANPGQLGYVRNIRRFVPTHELQKKNANLGYFFVNFINPEDATRCSELLAGQPFGTGFSAKRCEVSAAHIQGYSRMVCFFKRKAVLRSKGPPLFIAKGVPLTPETLEIQALVNGGRFVYSL